jgi:hypothetical protein
VEEEKDQNEAPKLVQHMNVLNVPVVSRNYTAAPGDSQPAEVPEQLPKKALPNICNIPNPKITCTVTTNTTTGKHGLNSNNEDPGKHLQTSGNENNSSLVKQKAGLPRKIVKRNGTGQWPGVDGLISRSTAQWKGELLEISTKITIIC